MEDLEDVIIGINDTDITDFTFTQVNYILIVQIDIPLYTGTLVSHLWKGDFADEGDPFG